MLVLLHIWFVLAALIKKAYAQFWSVAYRVGADFSSFEVSALCALQTSCITPLTQASTLSLLRSWFQTSVGLREMFLSGGVLSLKLNCLAKRLAKFSDTVVTISLDETAANAAMKCGVVSAMRRVTPCKASCASSSEIPSPIMPMLTWLKRL
jgi:hypothetical protein